MTSKFIMSCTPDLFAGGLGLELPSNVTVDGVQVSVERDHENPDQTVTVAHARVFTESGDKVLLRYVSRDFAWHLEFTDKIPVREETV